MALGRISGPLLKSNLVRDGVNLAFETNLLFLDVVNSRVGVNNSSPTTDLHVTGTTRTTNLTVDTELDIANITLTGNTITSTTGTLNLAPAAGQAVVYQNKLQIGNLQLTNNVLSSTTTNTDINLTPNGTGKISLNTSTDVNGNLYVSGNITADGNISLNGNLIIGDQQTDTVTINASINSNLTPSADFTYDIGSPTLRWRAVYANTVYTDSLNVPNLSIGNLSFSGNTISSASGLDLTLLGTGTGGVNLGNFRISGNVITNTLADAVTEIAQTGSGYFKINTTNGFVPPVGSTQQRPSYAVLGMTRYNTDTKALEIFDGSVWQNPAGTSGSVSYAQATDIAVQIALMLG